LFSRRFIYGVE